MDDDRLASELQRRASAASPRQDWAQRDLLPAVWHEIEARPERVLASRRSPLAGLATLVVALLVVAVAAPRLVPAPPTSTAAPSHPHVMSTADFAAQLASDELRGQTVLVDGAIATSAGPAQPTPSCAMPTGCYMGELWGSDPPISVAAPLIRTTDLAHAIYVESGVAPDGWRFWRAARPAVQGTLLLAVANDGSVQFIGIPRAGQAGPVWSVADAAAVDINSLGPDEVVLVDGWLGGISGAALRCHAPIGPIERSLPVRYCGDEWIATEATPSEGTQLDIQNGAYEAFALNPSDGATFEPRHATYALAPRLEGWCGGAQPPCWQWNVVARVDARPAVVPTPTPSPTAPAASLLDCGSIPNAGFEPSSVLLADSAGAVTSCSAEPRRGDWPAGDANVMVQAAGSADQVEVVWRTEACSPQRVLLDLRPTSGGFALRVIVDHSGAYGWECGPGDVLPPEHALVTFTDPVDPADVSVELVTEPGEQTQTRAFDCSAAAPAVQGSLTPGRTPRVVDNTGLITRCTQLEAGAPGQTGVDFTNLNGFDSVRFDWVDRSCGGPIAADFHAVAGGYELAVKEPSQACASGPAVALQIDIRIPMPVELVTAKGVQPPPVVACADTPNVTVVDEVGVVGSCAPSDNATSPAEGDIGIQNPGGDTSALQVSWSGALCTYEIHLSLLEPGEYGMQIYRMSTLCRAALVTYSLTLHLTSPIPADQVTFSSIGGPPRTPSPSPETSPTPIPSTPASLPCEIYNSIDTGLSVPRFIDETGLVSSCTSTDSPYSPVWPVIVVQNIDDPIDRVLQISWVGSTCDGDSTVTFARVADRYTVTIDRGTGSGCHSVAVRWIRLNLAEPVDASRVDLNDWAH